MFYKNFTRHLPTLNQSGGLACGFSFAGKILEGGTGMWRQLHGSMLMKTGKIDEELLNLLERGRTLTAQRQTGLGFGEAHHDQGRGDPSVSCPCCQPHAAATRHGQWQKPRESHIGQFLWHSVWAGAGG